MNRYRIQQEIARHMWAMKQDAFRVMLDISNRITDKDLGADDAREVFHKAQKTEMAGMFGSSLDGSLYSSYKDGVGFLMIDGPIIPRATAFSEVSGIVSIDRLMSEFSELEKRESIKKIVLLLDSPGGSISGITDFSAQIKNSTKETFAFIWNAESAGYTIASAAGTIISSKMGVVGSVGVVATITDTSKADEKKGIRYVEIVSEQSPYKRVDVDNPEEVATIKKTITDLADEMIEVIADGRGTTAEAVKKDFGKGGSLAPTQALAAGMIDGITDVSSFVNELTAQKNNSIFQLQAATMQATRGEIKMNPEELRKEHGEAVSQIEAAAAKQEADRIKSVEKLMTNFTGALPAIQKAAQVKVDELKFDSSMTPEKASLALLAVTTQAQVGAFDEFAKTRREAATTAAQISASPDLDEETKKKTADAAKVNGMLAGAGIVKEVK